MAKLLYFALLFGVFHNFLPAFVVSYQEYNWDKITFKTDLIADYIIQEKKNVYVKIKVESVLKKKSYIILFIGKTYGPVIIIA